jgi:ribosome biogenesis GTPase YqeH
MKLKCAGCGAELQFEDPRKPGYIPFEVYERRLAEGKEILCQRCFRIKHYGVLEAVEMSTDFTKELKNVLGSFELILWVIDATDFEGTYREEISSLLVGKKVVYAITKVDLLPKALTKTELKEWIRRRINPKFSRDIRLVSSTKKFGINSLRRHLLSFGTDKALVIGVTNVGKSSLVNELSESTVLTSSFPGTTLGMMRRKIKGARFYLYDTPGIMTRDRIVDLLTADCQKKIVPSRGMTRKTFKPSSERAYLLGGMVRILVKGISDPRPIFQIFTYQNVKLHETKPEKADILMEKRSGDLLIPPCENWELDGIEWAEEEHELSEEKELAIAGLGWINVKRGPLKVSIKFPKGIKIVRRDRLISPKR